MAEKISSTDKFNQIQTKIPLHNSTTYSGADTRVFIYRDLAALLDKIDSKKRDSKDQGVSLSNTNPDPIPTNQDSYQSNMDGTVSKGQYDPSSSTYKRATVTNVVDDQYTQAGTGAAYTANGSSARSDSDLGVSGISSIVTELGSLHSLNYSAFREKTAVRTLGRTHARAYTRGQRTIAGTMIFNVLQSHELLRFGNSVDGNDYTMLDQIDPFNLLVMFSNEYGSMSALHLFNVDVNTESQGMSIDAIMLQNTMNFYAQDMLPMEDIGNVFSDTASMLNEALNNAQVRDLQKRMQSRFVTGLSTINSASDGESRSDRSIQGLLQRSRGLF
jgi:hypothetical protein